MTAFVFANNVNTTLAASASTGSTTLTLASSAGLPTLATGQVMPITLNDAATGQIYEICYVTAISGVTLTVTRAQEGTAAQAWSIGDHAFVAFTAGTVAAINGGTQTFSVGNSTSGTSQAVPRSQADSLYVTAGGNNTFTGNNAFSNPVSGVAGTASDEFVILGQFLATFTDPGELELPGGFIVKWGTAITNSGGTAVVTFTTAFPTAAIGVVATPSQATAPTVDVTVTGSLTASGFNLYTTNATVGVAAASFWIAIGH